MSLFDKILGIDRAAAKKVEDEVSQWDYLGLQYKTKAQILQWARNPNWTRAIICEDKAELDSIRQAQGSETRYYIGRPPFENSDFVTLGGWLVIGEPIPTGYAPCEYCGTIKQKGVTCHACGGI